MERSSGVGGGSGAEFATLLQRIGAAYAAPVRAFQCSQSADGRGRAPNDLALLLVFGFALARTAEIITAALMAADGDLGPAAQGLLALAAHDFSMPLLFVFISGIGLTVLAGKRRRPGSDFDMACIASVPLVGVQLLAIAVAGVAPAATAAARVAAMAAYGWAIVLVALAYLEIRKRPRRDAKRGPAEVADVSASLSPRVLGLVGGLFFLALAALSTVEVASGWDDLGPVRRGDTAPEFQLPTIGEDGTVEANRLSLADLRGQVVVLDFWEAWCEPCRVAMPVLNQVSGDYRDQGVVFLSINTEGRDGAQNARRVLDKLGNGPTLLSDDGDVARRYRVTTIPHLVVVDRHGIVVAVHRGFEGTAALEAFLIAELRALL